MHLNEINRDIDVFNLTLEPLLTRTRIGEALSKGVLNINYNQQFLA